MSSLSAPTKFVPLSLHMTCGYLLLEQNLLSANIKESVVRSQTISRGTARVFRQVNIAPHYFVFPIVNLVLLDCFVRIGPKKLIPVL